jgi:sec-independent protein translocase protein TatA
MGIENPVHLLFIGAVALLVLGPRRLPDLAKSLGNGIREFRESMSAGEDDEPVAPQAPPPADPPVATEAPAAQPVSSQAPAAPAPEQSANGQA